MSPPFLWTEICSITYGAVAALEFAAPPLSVDLFSIGGVSAGFDEFGLIVGVAFAVPFLGNGLSLLQCRAIRLETGRCRQNVTRRSVNAGRP